MNNKYKNILIPLDLSCEGSWRSALPTAINQSQQHNATLHLMTVAPNAEIPAISMSLPDDLDQRIFTEHANHLKQFATQWLPDGLDYQTIVAQGRIQQQILHIANKIDADLIVMASHRPELRDYLISANAAHITRHAYCSVLVVRETVLRGI